MTKLLRTFLVLSLIAATIPTPSLWSQHNANTLEEAVLAALTIHLHGPVSGAVIGNVKYHLGWAFGTVALPAVDDIHSSPQGWLFLAQKTDNGWIAAVEYTQMFDDWLLHTPESLVSSETKSILTVSRATLAKDGSAQLSLPWATNGTWKITGGPHHNLGDGSLHPWSALDFGGGSGMVQAARDGIAFLDCANFVRVRHSDGWETGYYHLVNIPSNIHGKPISRGQFLGNISSATGCGGSSTGPHVHFSLRLNGLHQEIKDRVIGGWTVEENSHYNGCLRKDNVVACAPNGLIYNDGTVGSGGSTNFICPTASNGVILYRDPYDNNKPDAGCGGKGDGSGYVRRDSAGWQNMPSSFNDIASSIRVPSGWSVKLYQHSDRGGAFACRTANDMIFWGDKMNDGRTSLDDNVSSFEVFTDSNCGVNNPPRTPALQQPSDNYVALDALAPTLCWSTPGDPDGDSVQYFAEVFDSPVNSNSGWISNNCWRPDRLDGQYFSYQWRVKARDDRGLESGWSSIRRFVIERPNDPPHVSFDRANDISIGANDQSIRSNQQSWVFAGTASDSDGQVHHVDVLCEGDSCGNRTVLKVNGASNWNASIGGMSGRNQIIVYGYDNQSTRNSGNDRSRIWLLIDIARPSSQLNLNGLVNPNSWPTWFNTPVTVQIHASDTGTGSVPPELKELRYRRSDAGSWQVVPGGSASFTIDSEGEHTVEYYALDAAGNQEQAINTARFRIDHTPPSAAANIRETNGIVSNQWQNTLSTPVFSWDPASDNLSGVAFYEFQLVDAGSSAMIAQRSFEATEPRNWTPAPDGLRTGEFILKGRTRDGAGNWSNWALLYTFRYDGTSPENPTNIRHTQAITSEVWQRVTSLADFSWTNATDEGSGIKGQLLSWGTDPDGVGTTFITTNRYQSTSPLCGPGQACTGYLRLRSEDNVGNQANNWSTAYVLRYDDAPPTLRLNINGGANETSQTVIKLNIDAEDQGSGLTAMRFSHDGHYWTDWEKYASTRLWSIPAVSGQSWPVYTQVMDGVGLFSPVVTATILLDVNPDRPRSTGYQLFTYSFPAGSGTYTSARYQGRGTLGQVSKPASIHSTQYQLNGGYEAASQAAPLIDPEHDEFILISGIFGSGPETALMTSSRFDLQASLGQAALPINTVTISSSNYLHRAGFLAFFPRPLPAAGEKLEPQSPARCSTPGIEINNGAPFTNSPQITLTLCTPFAGEVMVSNNPELSSASWEPFTATRPWELNSTGQEVLPRTVYVAFRDTAGIVHGVYIDDIIYDPTPPSGAFRVDNASTPSPAMKQSNGFPVKAKPTTKPLPSVQAQPDSTVELAITAQDLNSGVMEMQVSNQADFADTIWEPYSALKNWRISGDEGLRTVYLRFRDQAGNVSHIERVTFMLDSSAPIGGITLAQQIIGPHTITNTLHLGATDEIGNVVAMRIGSLPDLSDGLWQPYTTILTMPINPSARDQGIFYAQYRDDAGNESQVYSDTYTVDNTPPLLLAEVMPGISKSRLLSIYAYDSLSTISSLQLSNDSLFDNPTTLPFTENLAWTFDDRYVVWIRVSDVLGNFSEPLPVLASDFTQDSRLQFLPLVRR